MNAFIQPQAQSLDKLRQFFDGYAAQLINLQQQQVDEALKRRQVAPQESTRLEEIYKISLKLGKDIPLDKIKHKILQQLDAAADFIRDFHIGVLGQKTAYFQLHEIEIYMDYKIKSLFRFSSGKLLIHIPYSAWWFDFYTLTSQEIAIRWENGDQLHKLSPIHRYWWLLNPIGEFRASLRSMLKQAGQNQILKIDNLLDKFGLNRLGSKYNSAEEGRFKDEAIALLKDTVSSDKLGRDLTLILKNQSESMLLQLLSKYKHNLIDPRQREAMVEVGALTMQEAQQQEDSHVNIKMFGMVNVGNYHRIDVAINLNSGDLKKYVQPITRQIDINVVLWGMVNVYTIDDVTVKPSVHWSLAVDWETAALEKSLKELHLLQ